MILAIVLVIGFCVLYYEIYNLKHNHLNSILKKLSSIELAVEEIRNGSN